MPFQPFISGEKSDNSSSVSGSQVSRLLRMVCSHPININLCESDEVAVFLSAPNCEPMCFGAEKGKVRSCEKGWRITCYSLYQSPAHLSEKFNLFFPIIELSCIDWRMISGDHDTMQMILKQVRFYYSVFFWFLIWLSQSYQSEFFIIWFEFWRAAFSILFFIKKKIFSKKIKTSFFVLKRFSWFFCFWYWIFVRDWIFWFHFIYYSQYFGYEINQFKQLQFFSLWNFFW